MNPSHQPNEEITPLEMYGVGSVDIVIKDIDLNDYYIHCNIGGTKQHTYDNGIIQTFKAYPAYTTSPHYSEGEVYPITSNYSGVVAVEFFGAFYNDQNIWVNPVDGLNSYSVSNIIFYKNEYYPTLTN